jgi:tetratricopeptide (TPR) repeat protein
MAHFGEDEIEDLWRDQPAPGDRRVAVWHLLEGCDPHLQSLREVVFPKEPATPEELHSQDQTYDAAFDRAWKAARDLRGQWREEQEGLKALLSGLREGNRAEEGTKPHTMKDWTYVELLLRLSFELRYRDPRRMLQLAEQAQILAETIRRTPYGEGYLSDLKARVWIELGNAYRVNERYRRAEKAVAQARHLIEEEAPDPLVRARVDDVEASLCRDQRNFEKACELLDRAYDTYSRLGEHHRAGRVLVKKGTITQILPSQAIAALRRGIDLLDPGQDPHLLSVAQQALLNALIENGSLREAGQLLLESGLRQSFADDPSNLLRLRWVEAKILLGHGRLDETERAFGEVRAGFQEMALDYDAALVGLDLAGVLLRQGRKPEAKGLASELYRTFEERGIHREAVRALQFFEIVCVKEVANFRMAEEVRKFLDRLQSDPGLRFEPEQVIHRSIRS